MDQLSGIFRTHGFMPHGHCYLWTPDVLWLHVGSDLVITLSYYSIPAALLVFLRRRPDVAFPAVFWLFIAFIFACGTTHLVQIWTTWNPTYRFEGMVKALTAGVSLTTAIVLWPLLPKAVALPSPRDLAAANEALAREVEQRRQAEAQLRARNLDQSQRLAALVDSSDDAIVSKALDGTIQSWNAGAERLYGYRADEVIGKKASVLFGNDDQEDYAAVMRGVLEGRPDNRLETWRRRKDGSLVHVALTLSPIRDASGEIVAASAIARDITEQRETQQRLERINTELKRRGEEIEQLMYAVSHDLRSPLVTVGGFAAIAQEELQGQDVPAAAEAIQRIQRACERAGTLIDDLLQLSRAGRSIEPQWMELSDAVHEVRELLEARLAAAGATLHVRDTLPRIWADRTSVFRIFDNLLTNALKYGLGGDSSVVELGVETTSTHWILRIIDHGPGIPEPTRARAFEPYARPASSTEGSGLGLAIVERLARAHGGSAAIEDTPGGGTTVRVELSRPTHG